MVRLFYDRGRNILLTPFSGELNEENLDALTDAVRDFIQQNGPCHGLLDYTEVTTINLSRNTVMQRASKRSISHGMTRVFVAPSDLNYAWCRMFQITQDVTQGDKPYVVRSMREAYEILNIDTDDFEPVDDPEGDNSK